MKEFLETRRQCHDLEEKELTVFFEGFDLTCAGHGYLTIIAAQTIQDATPKDLPEAKLTL